VKYPGTEGDPVGLNILSENYEIKVWLTIHTVAVVKYLHMQPFAKQLLIHALSHMSLHSCKIPFTLFIRQQYIAIGS